MQIRNLLNLESKILNQNLIQESFIVIYFVEIFSEINLSFYLFFYLLINMSSKYDAVWINASPSLKKFDLPLQQHLSKLFKITPWEYIQNDCDESSSIETALELLYIFFLKSELYQVHLIGHGISGAIALLFARLYPWRIRTLTLLAVSPQPATTWHAHYYTQRHLFFNFSRQEILTNIVHSLFGIHRIPHRIDSLIAALDKDLNMSPCMHSLFKIVNFPAETVSVPLMVCGSNTDTIVSKNTINTWTEYFKNGDTLWFCPDGYHFFHYFHPQLVGNQINHFWQNHSV